MKIGQLKNIEIEDNSALITINPEIYPLSAIFTAAYCMCDKAYMLIDGSPAEEIFVEITPKDNTEPIKLVQEYSGQLEVDYVCKMIHEGDDELCQANADGKYLDWTTSQKLTSDFGVEEDGTPILVFNCGYKRIGSYALRDASMNTTVEYDDLKTVIDSFLQ